MLENLTMVDCRATPLSRVRILIAQLYTQKQEYDRCGGLLFRRNVERDWERIASVLDEAKRKKVNAVVFPELAVPEQLIPRLATEARSSDITIIGGSHYYLSGSQYVSRCPVMIGDTIHYTEKNCPSPYECSATEGKGLTERNSFTVFQNTPVGNFVVAICSDYLVPTMRQIVEKEPLDFIFVPAFQRDSRDYYTRMDIDCDDALNGVYIAYSNNWLKDEADGRSALFAQMDHMFLDTLPPHATKLGKYEVCAMQDGQSHMVVELDMKNKRPPRARKVSTRPNVRYINVQPIDAICESYTCINKIDLEAEAISKPVEDAVLALNPKKTGLGCGLPSEGTDRKNLIKYPVVSSQILSGDELPSLSKVMKGTRMFTPATADEKDEPVVRGLTYNHFFQPSAVVSIYSPDSKNDHWIAYNRDTVENAMHQYMGGWSFLWSASYFYNMQATDKTIDEWLSLAELYPQKAESQFTEGPSCILLKLLNYKISMPGFRTRIMPLGVVTNDLRNYQGGKRVYTQYVFHITLELNAAPSTWGKLAQGIDSKGTRLCLLPKDSDPERVFRDSHERVNYMDVAAWNSIHNGGDPIVLNSGRTTFRRGFVVV